MVLLQRSVARPCGFLPYSLILIARSFDDRSAAASRTRHTPRKKAGYPVRRGVSIENEGLWDTGSPPEPVIRPAEGQTGWRVTTADQEGALRTCPQRHSGMVRQHQTADAQLRIGESRGSGFALARAPE